MVAGFEHRRMFKVLVEWWGNKRMIPRAFTCHRS
jgi:hypothetical protein